MLSINELVNKILSIAITSKFPIKKFPKNIVKDIQSLFPQKITSADVNEINKSISNGLNWFDALNNSQIRFPLKENILMEFIGNPKIIKEEPKVTTTIILFSFLFWCVDHVNQKTSEHLSLIFESVKTLSINCSNNDSEIIAISSLYSLSSFILSQQFEDTDFPNKITLILGAIDSIPNIPASFFDLIVKATYILVEDQNATIETLDRFILFILHLLKEYKEKFPMQIIDILPPIISKIIPAFSKSTINYLATVSQVVGMNAVAIYLPSILLAFATRIKELAVFPKVVDPSDDSNIVMFPTRVNVSIPEGVSKNFSTELVEPVILKTLSITLPQPEWLKNIISPDLLQFLSMTTEALQGKKELVGDIMNMLFGLFEDDAELNHSYDAFAFLIIFVTDLYESCKFIIPLELMLHKTIFDPSITVFNQGDNFLPVNSLRYAAMDFLVDTSLSQLYRFIIDSSRTPNLFAENLYRLCGFMRKIRINRGIVQTYYSLLLESNTYYKEMTSLSEAEIISIREARLAIFYVLEKLMRNEKIIVQFFTDDKFLDSYLPLVVETALQPFILSTFAKFATTTYITENSIFGTKIISLLDDVFQNLNESAYITKCRKLLDGLNEIVENDQVYCLLFSKAIPSICNGALKLPKSTESSLFLISMIQFLTSETRAHHLKNVESSALETTISRVVGKDPPQEYFDNLISLAAGLKLPESHSQFLIKQPKALRTLLLIYSESHKFHDVLKLIEQLCTFSEENTKMMHNDEIEIVLLDIIQQYREKESNDESIQLIQDILDLFSYIANYTSSVSVVQNFVSLFCLINGRYFPWFHRYTIDTFISLLSKAETHRIETVPFIHSSEFEVKHLSSDMIADGFTFCAWVFSNSSMPQYTPQLFTMSDKKGQEIAAGLSFSEITIYLNQKVTTVNYHLPPQEWTFVSLAFQVDKTSETEQMVVHIYRNSDFITEFSQPLIKFEKGSLHCTIGGLTEMSIDLENPSACSQFALYKYLDHESIRLANQAGCRSGDFGCSPIFIFLPHEPVDIILMKNIVPNSDILSITEITSIYPSSFADIFTKRCGPELILPLIAQWGMKFSNDEEMADLPSKSIQIFREILLRNVDIQKRFDEQHGIEILSFLLLSAKKKSITYQLYMSLYDIYCVLNDLSLKRKLLKMVLLNIELWIYVPGNDHLKILQNWKKELFSTSNDLAMQSYPFQWFINIMRMHYYYTDCEPELQKSKPADINIKTARKILLFLALEVANQKFTSKDLVFLICTITTCRDSQQQLDYLHVLNTLIIKGKQSPLLNASDSFQYLKILQYEANNKNSEIALLAMQTLCNAYRASYFTQGSDTQFDIILHQMNIDLVTDEFLNSVISQITKRMPELFVVASWMALNLGEKAVEKLYSELEPDQAYTASPTWYIWGLFSMFKEKKFASKIASFLIKCSISSFPDMYIMAEAIGTSYDQSSGTIKILLFDEFYHILKEQKERNEQHFQLYFRFARHFLFYSPKSELNHDLDYLIRKSPFHDKTPVNFKATMQWQEQVNKNRNRPQLNADGTERYSPELGQRASQLLIPVKESRVNEAEQATHAGIRRMRKNSIFAITKQKSGDLFFNQAPLFSTVTNKGRRSARVMVQSTNNYILPNDFIVVSNEYYFNPFSFHFSIHKRQARNSDNRYKIEWFDKRTAIQFLHLFSLKPLREFESTVAMIAAFMVLVAPDVAAKALSEIDIQKEDLRNAIAFYDRNAGRVNQKVMLQYQDDGELLFKASEFLDNFETEFDREISSSCMPIIENIRKYENENSIASFEIFSMLTPEWLAISPDSIVDLCDTQRQFKSNSNKLWQHLWHSISIERAPWHKSLPPNMLHQIHYRRDLTHCYADFPPKLKQNYKFDIHLEASLVRDTGSIETGRSKAEEYKQQLKRMYQQENDAISLFELADESFKRKSSNDFTEMNTAIELPCEVIKINKTYENGTFLLTSKSIVLTLTDKKSYVIELRNVKSIFPRTRFHHKTAIEIFTIDGLSYFINFPNFSTSQVIKSFGNGLKIHPIDFKSSIQHSKMTEKWQHREISNFQYLMALNIYSGRSTNDITQYPVFPWILSDYSSKELDFNDPSIYRDLSKPVGALNEARLAELKEKSQHLEEIGLTPYLYSSCYLCPLSVCLYLMRLEPYTTMHIEIQGGHFDIPARLFHTIKGTYKLCNTIANDYRELIPEFFTMHEFLVNNDRFDLGYKDQQRIDDVKLPKWANHNPLEFIYKHRKALESEYVSQNLNHWIDLIWGDKQRGEKAKQANNIFMKEMYDDIWDTTPLDDVDLRSNVEAILCHLGQIPPMLFDKPHPVIDPLPNKVIPTIQSDFIIPVTATIINLAMIANDKTVNVIILDSNCVLSSFTFDPFNISKYVHNEQKASSGYITLNSAKLANLSSSLIDVNDNIKNDQNPSVHPITRGSSRETIPPQGFPQSGRPPNPEQAQGLKSPHLIPSSSNKQIRDMPNLANWANVQGMQSRIRRDSQPPAHASPEFTNELKNSYAQASKRPQVLPPSKGLKQRVNTYTQKIKQQECSSEDGQMNPPPTTTPIQPQQKPSLFSGMKKFMSNFSSGQQDSQQGGMKLSRSNPSQSSEMLLPPARPFRPGPMTKSPSIELSTFGYKMPRNSSISSFTGIANGKETPKAICCFNGIDSFDFVGENLHEVYRVFKNKKKLQFKHRSEITNLASEKNWTAVADRDSIVSLYLDKKLKFTIPLFSSSIKCLAINSTYHTVICGTRDGFLLFGSLNSGIVRRTVNLCNMRPIQLLITPSWGFVAVYVSELCKGELIHAIKLFTVNGDFINSKIINHPVYSWTAFSTMHGFDYIIMTDTNNDCFLFEAFYLNFGESIYSSEKPISTMAYINSASCAVLATDSGNLTFITAKIPE